MEPAGNARPVEPPLPAENPWGNPIRWSCLKIPCHCAFHLRFPRGKTLWIGVYRPPPTPGSHGCDSRSPRGRASRGGLRSRVLDGLLVCAYAGQRARGRDRASAPLDDARRRPLPPANTAFRAHARRPSGQTGLGCEQTAEPIGKAHATCSRGWAHQSAWRCPVGLELIRGAGTVRAGRGFGQGVVERSQALRTSESTDPARGADEQPGPNPDLSATAEAGCPNLSIPPNPARRP